MPRITVDRSDWTIVACPKCGAAAGAGCVGLKKPPGIPGPSREGSPLKVAHQERRNLIWGEKLRRYEASPEGIAEAKQQEEERAARPPRMETVVTETIWTEITDIGRQPDETLPVGCSWRGSWAVVGAVAVPRSDDDPTIVPRIVWKRTIEHRKLVPIRREWA